MVDDSIICLSHFVWVPRRHQISLLHHKTDKKIRNHCFKLIFPHTYNELRCITLRQSSFTELKVYFRICLMLGWIWINVLVEFFPFLAPFSGLEQCLTLFTYQCLKYRKLPVTRNISGLHRLHSFCLFLLNEGQGTGVKRFCKASQLWVDNCANTADAHGPCKGEGVKQLT